MPFTTKAGPLELFVASKNSFAANLGKRGESFAERVWEDFEQELVRIHKQRDAIKSGGEFTPHRGQPKELTKLLVPAKNQFETKRAKNSESLNTAIASVRSSVRAITTETSDPNQQIIRQHRMQRLDAHLRNVDPLERGLRMRLALEDPTATATALLADTLREAEIVGLPIVDRESMSRFLRDLQDRATPEIAEIAEYRDALDAMAEQALNEVRRLAEEDRIDLALDGVAS